MKVIEDFLVLIIFIMLTINILYSIKIGEAMVGNIMTIVEVKLVVAMMEGNPLIIILPRESHMNVFYVKKQDMV